MSETISFSRIPAGANLLIPGFFVEFDPSRAQWGSVPKRTVVLGMSTALTATQPMYVPSPEAADNLFGYGSHMARLLRAYRRNDGFGELWCVPFQAPAGATAAQGAILFAGTMPLGASHHLYLGGDYVPVPVPGGASAGQQATAVAAAIMANPNSPVTATVSSATVNLTARTGGAWGNSIPVAMNVRGIRGGESTPTGVTVTVTPMAGGAGVPLLTGLDDLLAEEAYDFVVNPFNDAASLDAVSALLDDVTGRWAWNRQVYGLAFSCGGPTLGLRNDPRASAMDYFRSATPDWEWAAAYAGAVAPALVADPARPVHTLPILGVWAPEPGFRRKAGQQNTLLGQGVSTFTVAVDGTVQVQRAVTTYQRNAAGQVDRSWLDVETPFTLMEVTRRLRAHVQGRFPRAKLASDPFRAGPGTNIVTPSIIRAELIVAYAQCVRDGLCENEAGFAEALVVQRDGANPNRANVLYPPDLMNQLRQVAVVNQFRA